MNIDKLTGIVVDKAVKIHYHVGCGCFEKIYEELLYYELCKAGLEVKRQLIMPLIYDEKKFGKAYKLDLLVEDRLIVEVKAVVILPPVYLSQIRSHLYLTKLKHGMLLNFWVPKMVEGIHRVFNNNGRESIKV